MSKIFRIDYYPNQAYLDFSMLEADHVGVLIQVCNLIYMNQGPIENDPKWISRSIRNMGSAKTKRIIENLIQDGHLTITKDQKITKKMCEIQLETVQDRREFHSKIGKKGAKTRYENEQNQELNFSGTKGDAIASTSTSTRDRVLPPNPQGGTGGDPSKNQPQKKKGRKRNGKSNLAEQASKLMDKYRDPEPDHDDDSVL